MPKLTSRRISFGQNLNTEKICFLKHLCISIFLYIYLKQGVRPLIGCSKCSEWIESLEPVWLLHSGSFNKDNPAQSLYFIQLFLDTVNWGKGKGCITCL